MNSAQPRAPGFTLIELMIVMSIVALLMGMVGPLAINNLERAQAKQEILTIKTWLIKMSDRSFFTGRSYFLYLNDNEINLYAEENKSIHLKYKEFNYVSFERQEVVFNKYGIPSVNSIKALYKNTTIDIELNKSVIDDKKSN